MNIFVLLSSIIVVWVVAGGLYLKLSDSYEGHGLFSLLIIFPYCIVGALWAYLTGPHE